MFHRRQNWMMVALLALPAMAQQYPPQQQSPQQGQYPPQRGPYSQQQQYPAYNPPAVNYGPEQLDQMVSRIALYPDPLLAQIFAAATFPDQIQPASQWADQHHYLTGQQLANAIQNDQLGFDPSVQALLPFPSVLQMMAGDMDWTVSIGNAFMSEGPLLQDAVQRMRGRAYDNGYLRSNNQIAINRNGPWTEIAPLDPGYIVVPYYDPAIVYYRPYRPGFRYGISFGYGVGIGAFFNPWGWGGNRFLWDNHQVYVANRIWDRPYIVERHVTSYRSDGGYITGGRPDIRPEQRGGYEQRPGPVGRGPEAGRGPDRGPMVSNPAPRPDQHVLQGRNAPERRAAESGRPSPRESHGGEERRRR